MKGWWLAVGAALIGCGGGEKTSTTTPFRPTVARVLVASDKSAIVVGASATFTATPQDAAGASISGRVVTWTSSNSSVAQVNTTGLATGLTAGTTTLTATVEGVSGSAPLTVVVPSVATVEVTGAPSTPLFTGQTAQLSTSIKDSLGNVMSGRAVTWSSSNAGVATVADNGIVTAVVTGSTTISATSGGKTGTAIITVATRTVATIAVTPTQMLVTVGGTAAANPVARDQQGGALGGLTFTYQTSDATVATVSASGVVSGLRTGSVTLTVTSQGISGTTAVTVLSPTVLIGHVYTADGGALPALRVTAQTGTSVTNLQTFTTTVDAAGTYRVDVPLTTGTADSIDLIVDALSGARTYRPIAARVPNSRVGFTSSRPLLVPRAGVFNSPTYGSTTMNVSLDQAFTRVCTDNTNANCNSYFPQMWKTGVPLWLDADLPVALAFNRVATTSPISAADSIALWNVIHQMEADFGRPLFKPANAADFPAADANGFSPKVVLVFVDNTLTGFAGYTNWIWDGNLNMLSAKTRVTQVTALANRSLMTHELLHALGFHHTCAWTTVMGGYGCTSAAGATRADVAAFHLGYAVRRTILANATTTTFGDALRGEQLFDPAPLASRTGGAATIAFAERANRAFLFHGQTVTSDGAP